MTVNDTQVELLPTHYGNRPEYMIQNAGPDAAKFDFNNDSLTFADDNGFILESGDSLIIGGRLALHDLQAIGDAGGVSRILIANPGKLKVS